MCVAITAIFSFQSLLACKGESRKLSVSNNAVKQPSLATRRWSPFGVRPLWISPGRTDGAKKMVEAQTKVINLVTFCARGVVSLMFFIVVTTLGALAAGLGGGFL